MPQYQGVWSLQQQMQALTSGQWATDPLFDYTTLLLQGDAGANGAQNNVFYDTSPNQFAITRNGNTTQGTFSPFSATGWSNYFDGSSHLTVSSNPVPSTGNFTFECWIYSNGANTHIFGNGAANGFIVQLAGGYAYFGQYGVGTYTSPIPLPTNQFVHLAVVRNGSSWVMYQNGVSVVTTTWNPTFTGSTVTIAGGSGGGAGALTGYMSNVRVVNNATIYTGAFAPPTTPLTAVSGTQLLTCQSNRFVDNSASPLTITLTGTPSVQAFSPFAPQFQYTASGTGGSGYFDGTGDFLTVPANTAFAPGTGNFTVDGWIYPTSSSVQNFFAQTVSGTNYFLCTADVPNKQINIRSAASGAGTAITSAATLQLNQWNHFCISRTSGTITVWCNGSAGTPTSNTIDLNNTSYVPTISGYTHATGTEPLVGYLSGLRYIKGTALSGATVPTAPPTAITNTSLLTNFTNAGILDGTMKNNLETVGNASVSTSVVKYGSGSMYFDGTDDRLVMPSSQNLVFGTGDFTIEGWFYANSLSNKGVLQLSGTAGGLQGNETNNIAFALQTGNYTLYAANAANGLTGIPPLSTWTHFAIVRASGVTRLYINGTQTGSSITDTNNYSGGNLCIGGYYATGFLYNGYLDDIRITKGIARYTQNFTPPSVALPRQ